MTGRGHSDNNRVVEVGDAIGLEGQVDRESRIAVGNLFEPLPIGAG